MIFRIDLKSFKKLVHFQNKFQNVQIIVLNLSSTIMCE